jgi:predicted transposase
MKLTAKIKLIPDKEQTGSLKQTILIYNKACNFISETAWNKKVFGQYNLQKLLYKTTMETFNLTAQIVIQCICKVADAYKLDKDIQRKFKPLGAITYTYDSRILSWKTYIQFVSIWTVSGRLEIPYVCGDRQRELLNFQQGETDLVLIDGKFYLHTTCNIEIPKPEDFKDIIGIDRGIKNIATLSTGDNFASNHLLSVRCRYRNIRKKLQKKGTVSAKRLLKKRNKKENKICYTY